MGCSKSSDQKEIYYKEVNNYKEVREAGAWGLGPGPFAAVLSPGQTS